MKTVVEIESLADQLRLLAEGSTEHAGYRWGMLSPNWMRGVLRRAVESATKSAAAEPVLEQCWRSVRRREPCMKTIEAAHAGAIDCARLHQNLGVMIATGGAAFAAVRALNRSEPDEAAPQRVCRWLARASRCLTGEWEDISTPLLRAGDWTFDSSSGLIRKAADQLAAAGLSRTEAARYWADYWEYKRLGDSEAPLMMVPLGVKQAKGSGQIVELWLERVEATELIDHFDSALYPADNDFLETLREAQQAAQAGVVWSIHERAKAAQVQEQRKLEPEDSKDIVRPDGIFRLEGKSLGLAAHVAFRLLKGQKHYDESCLLIGQIRGGKVEKVEAERDKLKAVLETTLATGIVRRVGVAPGTDFGRRKAYPGVEIRPVRTIDEAVEYASGAITELQKYYTDLIARPGRESEGLAYLNGRSLAEIYVPVDVSESPQNPRVPWASVQERMRGDGLPMVVVTGPPGYGKSQLARMTLRELAQEGQNSLTAQANLETLPLPIGLTCTELAGQVDPQNVLLTKLRERFGKKSAVADYVGRQIENARDGSAPSQERIWFVVDGLDRVPADLSEKLTAALDTVASWKCRVIVTSRPEVYKEREGQFKRLGAAVYELAPWSNGQLERFLSLWFAGRPEAERQRVADALRQSPSLAALTEVPLLVAELCGRLAEPEQRRNTSPTNLTEYRLDRIAEWSRPGRQLDTRFVNLTLVLNEDKEDGQRERPEDLRFNDLRKVLDSPRAEKVLVVLGAPGSGKSTLLGRLQLDHSAECLRGGADEVSLFVPLGRYSQQPNGEWPSPRKWLEEEWRRYFPQLPLELYQTYLEKGRVLLLLDALDEIQYTRTAGALAAAQDYYWPAVRLWKTFAREARDTGNRLVFTCRTLDYSVNLSAEGFRVPRVDVQPMNEQQALEFLSAYIPDHAARVWGQLRGSPDSELLQTPFFLKLLSAQVQTMGDIPRGRAALFTGFVRQALQREMTREKLQHAALLDTRDHLQLNANKWATPFSLPETGVLIPKLRDLAFWLQQSGPQKERAQARISFDDALSQVKGGGDEGMALNVVEAAKALSLLDQDVASNEIFFYHQLFQFYFAARRLAREPDPILVHLEWKAADTKLNQTLAGLDDDEELPALPQTGWEETARIAVPMADNPGAFIRGLVPHNLPLAARCAASLEVEIPDAMKREIQDALIRRTQDMRADIRARIAAGEALGELGDPRFERRAGPHGDYLLPPLVDIPAGTYPIGDDKSPDLCEKPAHTVEIAAFRIGKFPVTNAEYGLFMRAGGYENERWWNTQESLAWLRSREARQPASWQDTRFNNKLKPIVGVSWFEARAFCNWLTANASRETFRLPTEAELEAAARGPEGRRFPYGNTFQSSRSNTWESHIRCTTPVGIFENATPEGTLDLTGNTRSWTSSTFRFYPYGSDDGREDQDGYTVRLSRGDSWSCHRDRAPAAFRGFQHTNCRVAYLGFRLVCVVRPPSL